MTSIIALVPDVQAQALQKLKDICSEYRIDFFGNISEEDYSDIEILLGWNSNVNRVIEQLQGLKWIQLESAGIDYLPQVVLDNPSIRISTTSGIHASAITESVFAYILSYGRGMYQTIQAQQDREWLPIPSDQLKTLPGKTMLIFGTGNIGKELARMASAFGMKVRGVNTDGRDVKHFSKCFRLDEALSIINTAHIVVNAMPLTQDTHSFFNLKFFQDMNPDSLFINVGRGSSVVEKDLYIAVKDKLIAGAYLDVFEKEPLENDSPLWTNENIIITPHITGKMHDYDEKLFPIFVENLCEYLKNGQIKRNLVDSKKGY